MKLMKKLFLILLIAALAVIISYFARVNDMRVDLDFVFYSFDSVPLWLMVLFSFLAGILFTVILVFVDIMFVNVKERSLKKENRSLKKELSKMRNRELETLDDDMEERDKDEDSEESEKEID